VLDEPFVAFSGIRYHVKVMGWFITLLVRVLEGMFVAGLAGTVLVLILSGIEDFKTLLGREDESHS
jgi:hypothetical protein